MIDPDAREMALLELSKQREKFPELAPYLWNSFGTMAVLLQVWCPAISYDLSYNTVQGHVLPTVRRRTGNQQAAAHKATADWLLRFSCAFHVPRQPVYIEPAACRRSQ